MFRFLLVISFTLFTLSLSAQFDTNFVHLTKKQFTAYPMTEGAYMELNFEDSDFDQKIFKTTLTSRRSFSVGLGMSFYRFGFSLSFQIPYSNIEELKDAKAFSFAGGYSYRRFYGELRYRDFKGFQRTDYLTDSINGKKIVRKDINLRQVGLALDYFFSKKYNFDANFKNYNIQKRSAGTFLVLMGANHYDIRGKYLMIDTNHYASEIELVKDLGVWSIKAAPGGAFSLVFFKHFYFSGLLAMGAAYNYNTITGDTRKVFVNKWAPVYEFHTVIGYNTSKWFASFSINFEDDYFFFDKVQTSVANAFYNFKVGYRFNSKHLGKLEKYI